MNNGKGKIIVVDDEPSVRDILYQVLKDEGYSVVTAKDGLDALAKTSVIDFDLMFLDVRMPGMSGLEVLSSMAEKHPKTVVVMLTAVEGMGAQHEAYQREAFAYLNKPCDLDEVVEIARQIINSRNSDDQITELCQ